MFNGKQHLSFMRVLCFGHLRVAGKIFRGQEGFAATWARVFSVLGLVDCLDVAPQVGFRFQVTTTMPEVQ